MLKLRVVEVRFVILCDVSLFDGIIERIVAKQAKLYSPYCGWFCFVESLTKVYTEKLLQTNSRDNLWNNWLYELHRHYGAIYNSVKSTS